MMKMHRLRKTFNLNYQRRFILVQLRKVTVRRKMSQHQKIKGWASNEDKKWLKIVMLKMRIVRNIFLVKFQNLQVHRNNHVLDLQLRGCVLWRPKLQLRIKKILRQHIRKYNNRNKLLTMTWFLLNQQCQRQVQWQASLLHRKLSLASPHQKVFWFQSLNSPLLPTLLI